MTTCIDTWAVVEWFRRGAAAPWSPGTAGRDAVISAVSLSELFTWLLRRRGESFAEDAVAQLTDVLNVDRVEPDIARRAGAIKANYRMSLGDSFVVATALAHDAPILTGDPEILDAEGPWRCVDLRAT